MLTENQMSLSTRKIERIAGALVVGVPERGKVSVVYLTPRGGLMRETVFCSGWQDLTPMESCIDLQWYLSGENHIGIKVLGLTPESVAEPVRKAILERMNE